jgi:predicted aconitase with swiveling domain
MYLFDVATGKIIATDMEARGEKLAGKLAELLK